MSIMPVYYTTNNTKKRKVNKKPGWKEAEADYAKWLKSIGIDPNKKNRKSNKEFVPLQSRNSTPIRETKHYPSLGTGIGNATKPDATYKKEVSANYVIGQAYNKGGMQVLSKAEVQDPMTGKRR